MSAWRRIQLRRQGGARGAIARTTPSALPEKPADELPDFAKKADDLEAIKKAVDDAASVIGTLWFSYLFALFYFTIATAAVTRRDLFLVNPVKLPFLNVELPLLTFFVLAPVLFLVVQAYALVHLVLLSDKAKRYHEELYRQISEKASLSKDELERRGEIRDSLRRQLPSNVFVQFLAGPSNIRYGFFGLALWSIAWITLVIAPVLLLTLFQLQFLPYHSSPITWTHRVVLLLDLLLLWWLWPKILAGREAEKNLGPAPWVWLAGEFTLCTIVIFFSWAIATFPGEWQDNRIAARPIFPTTDLQERAIGVSLHDWIFNSKVDGTTRHRWLPISSTLVLPGLNVYEGLGIDDPEKMKGRDFVFRARGRDLRGAIFDLASLPKVDFTGAQLEGASLNGAQLQGASLDGAQLQGASLDFAELQGASATKAFLQGSSLRGAELQVGCVTVS